MGIINSIASWVLKKRIHQIDFFIKYPIETQIEVFHSLIHRAKDTEWGKKFDYASINTLEQFRQRVPIQRYEDLFPEIKKVMEGQENVLWPGKTKWFSKSSGTTNDKSKFIPVTYESLEECHFKAGKDMVAMYLNLRENSQLFSGRSISIGGSHQVSALNTEAYYGDLSAVLIENLPVFFEMIRIPSKKVALMSEWEDKIRQMALEVLDKNVTNVVGVPTWTLVLFEKIFELSGNASRNMLEIMPNLEVFFHGGVHFEPYKAQFERLIPSSEMRYFDIYNASEGSFGIQYDFDTADLLLMLDYGIYFEFVPLEELAREHPDAISLDEVEVGTVYAMVISTNGGLWRYLIGDTVRFTQKYPFKFKISGRTRQYINAFGEELMVENAECAMSIVTKKFGLTVQNYTAAPKFEGTGQVGSHEWLIEFETPPHDLREFTHLLDSTLQSLNSDYEAKRYKNMALGLPVIHAVPSGTFYEWMKRKNKLGGQNKVPRLCNDRRYLDEISHVL